MTGRNPDRSPRAPAAARSTPFRAAIRVRPGASRVSVGGHLGAFGPDASDPLPPLVVTVTARAVDGAATAAAEAALAAALGVRPRQVRVVRGHTSREKLVEITDAGPGLAKRWRELLAG